MTQSRPLVVILDDDVGYAKSLCDVLSREVTDRTVAISSIADIATLDLSDIKCFIVDYYLSSSDSDSVTGLAQIRTRFPQAHVILHSGLAQPSDIIAAEKKGFDTFIPKAEKHTLPDMVALLREILKNPVTGETEGKPNRPEAKAAPADAIEVNDARTRSDQHLGIAHTRVDQDRRKAEKRLSEIHKSGKRPGVFLDGILSDLANRSSASRGSWFLIDDRDNRIINFTCNLLTNRAGISKKFGTVCSQLLEELRQADVSATIIGPIDLTKTVDNKKRIFQNGAVVACRFSLKEWRCTLLFVLELPLESSITCRSSISPYVNVLEKGLTVDFPNVFTRSEVGRIDQLAAAVERYVSWWQLCSRTTLLGLSVPLFGAASISAVWAGFVLVTATLGFPDILVDWHWKPSHYGTGVVNGLETLILAITLYLLGVGISRMFEHPRLSRVSAALRYLENPAEMKRSLALAVCTLLAVAGLKTVLELPDNAGSEEVFRFLAKMFGSVMLILVLVFLIERAPRREE